MGNGTDSWKHAWQGVTLFEVCVAAGRVYMALKSMHGNGRRRWVGWGEDYIVGLE